MAFVDEITQALCTILKDSGIEPELEHPVDQHRRVDVYGVIPRGNGWGCDVPIGIEIKTSRTDFKTGYGRNFSFPIAYIAVPDKLLVYTFGLKYIGYIPEHVGVLAWCNHETMTVAQFATANRSLDDWTIKDYMPFQDSISPFATKLDDYSIQEMI